jgi:beta-glucosidase
LDRPSARIVKVWFTGQEGGTALAAILFGDVNPSGKLPDTLAASRVLITPKSHVRRTRV